MPALPSSHESGKPEERKRIAELLYPSYGKHSEREREKAIGWDEIIDGGLAPDATVMSWRGMEGGIKSAKAGHHVIMTPTEHCYIDLWQGEPSVEPDTYFMCRLKDSYSFNPVPTVCRPR